MILNILQLKIFTGQKFHPPQTSYAIIKHIYTLVLQKYFVEYIFAHVVKITLDSNIYGIKNLQDKNFAHKNMVGMQKAKFSPGENFQLYSTY